MATRKAEIATYPPGTVLLDMRLHERAVPWSASQVTKNGAFKDKRLVAWQRIVRLHAAIERRGNGKPYRGPVEVHVVATFRPRPGSMPDATNVLKAIEDAIQDVVYEDDRQVSYNSCLRVRGDSDEVTIRVRTVEG